MVLSELATRADTSGCLGAGPFRLGGHPARGRGGGVLGLLLAGLAEPKVSDFTLKVRILEKQNSGSAGSNIVYRITAGWEQTYDTDKTCELTYEVRGGEDGPAISTMETTGDGYRPDNEEIISTASVSQRFTVKAVSVEEI